MLDFKFGFVWVFQVGCSYVAMLLSLVMSLRQRANFLDDSSVHIEIKAFKFTSTHLEALEKSASLECLLSGYFFAIQVKNSTISCNICFILTVD